MSNIIETLKGYISPALIAEASSSLGESPGNVTAALTSAFPSILGGLLNKSSDPQAMDSFLGMAKQQEAESSPNEVSLGLTGSEGLLDKGKDLIGSLFGNKSGDIANAIGVSSGVKSSSARSILTMAAPIVMGFFGKEALSGNWGVKNIVDFLKGQKDNIVNALPSGVGNLLGGKKKLEDNVRHASSQVRSVRWLKYIVYAALIGFLFFVINRSCTKEARKNEVTPMENTKSGGAKPGVHLNSGAQQWTDKLYEIKL